MEVVEEFTARGYVVASISIRSSSDARFPAQRIRRPRRDPVPPRERGEVWHRPRPISPSWAIRRAGGRRPSQPRPVTPSSSMARPASTAPPAPSRWQWPSSHRPTSCRMDAFAAANNLPMDEEIYPIDSPTSLVGLLIQCPGEGPSEGPPDPGALVSIQECPEETEKADPASYIDGAEVPIWLLHGLAGPSGAEQQSSSYTTRRPRRERGAVNHVPSAEHEREDIIDAGDATTWATNRGGRETKTVGARPSWADNREPIDAAYQASPLRKRARGIPSRTCSV